MHSLPSDRGVEGQPAGVTRSAAGAISRRGRDGARSAAPRTRAIAPGRSPWSRSCHAREIGGMGHILIVLETVYQLRIVA